MKITRTRGMKSQSRAKTRAQDSFPFNHEALRPHGQGQIILSLFWSTVVRKDQWQPWRHSLCVGWNLGEARGGLQRGCVQEKGQAGAARGQCYLVSLERLTEQIADGIRFPCSSSFPHHLSCQILSSEGIRPIVPSVLMLPWLQLYSHQQWDLTSSLESTEPESSKRQPMGQIQPSHLFP